jgi:hypothetical protein
MSGARTGAGPASAVVSVGGAATGVTRRTPMLRPATSATRATTAIDATAHGSVADTRGSEEREPTAAPHRWQNFAPALSEDRQAAQTAPSNGAPHEEQKRPPVDGVLHDEQVAGVGMLKPKPTDVEQTILFGR